MAKKKPHLVESALKSIFSEYRKNSYDTNYPGSDSYHVEPVKDGFEIILSSERRATQTMTFKTKKQVDEFLRKHSKPKK